MVILLVKVGTEFFLRKEGREGGGGTLREGQTGPIFLTSLNPDRRNRRSTHARGRSRTFCEAGRGSLSGFDPSPVGWFVYLCPVSQIRLVGVSPIGDRFGPPGCQQGGYPLPLPLGARGSVWLCERRNGWGAGVWARVPWLARVRPCVCSGAYACGSSYRAPACVPVVPCPRVCVGARVVPVPRVCAWGCPG